MFSNLALWSGMLNSETRENGKLWAVLSPTQMNWISEQYEHLWESNCIFQKFNEHQENKCFQRQTSHSFLDFRANPRLLYGCFLPVSKSFILSFLFLLISSLIFFWSGILAVALQRSYLISHSTSHSYMWMKQFIGEGNQLSWELLKVS